MQLSIPMASEIMDDKEDAGEQIPMIVFLFHRRELDGSSGNTKSCYSTVLWNMRLAVNRGFNALYTVQVRFCQALY